MKIVEQGIISSDPARGAYMPTVTPLLDGSWLACQHVGEGLGTPDNRIECLRSDDQGATWENEGCIHEAEEGWAYRGPHISKVPDGGLVMTATRFEANGVLFNTESEGLQRPEMLLFWSDDGGKTWSIPKVVSHSLPAEKYTVNGAGILLQLSPERWMYPLETWKPEGYEGPPDQKAGALFSSDGGQSWGEFTVVADDSSGERLWWDQMCTQLPDGKIYTMLWTHLYGTSLDLNNHWTASDDMGRTWSEPEVTNLRGQVCTPVALADGTVAAIYNHRHDPHGIRVAFSENMTHFDREIIIFDAGTEAALGEPENDNFLAEHMQIAFGKPGGVCLPDGDLLTYFWCTKEGITHTRWVRLTSD
jgi:hypothetical protein